MRMMGIDGLCKREGRAISWDFNGFQVAESKSGYQWHIRGAEPGHLTCAGNCCGVRKKCRVGRVEFIDPLKVTSSNHI